MFFVGDALHTVHRGEKGQRRVRGTLDIIFMAEGSMDDVVPVGISVEVVPIICIAPEPRLSVLVLEMI